MNHIAEQDAVADSTASTIRPEATSTTSPAKDDDGEVPVSARRAKAMSIGNAASLFGASDDSALLFGGGGEADASDKPAAMAQSPFGAIAEESEEPMHAVKQDPIAQSTGPMSTDAPSPSDDAAALFGDGGQTPPVEWLGGAGSSSVTASNDGASSLFSGVPSSQTAATQDSSLYASASGQFGEAQYGYDSTAPGQEPYAYQPHEQHQYAYPAQDQQEHQHYGQYVPQAGQQQAYGPYGQAAVENFSQSMYHDPAQQLQYSQSLQAQAHAQHQQTPAAVSGQLQTSYSQQQYSQYGDQYALAPGGQDQYASYYAQQPYPAQQSHPQHPTSAYQAQGYAQVQQSHATPYSAPAGPTYGNQLVQSHASQAGKPHYASEYSQSYDPYAPTQSPYVTQQSYQQKASGHVKQPSLSSSRTSPNLASSLQPTTSQSQPAKKDPKLNRSASSFFAELPPMPAKVRPTSAVGTRAGTSSLPPVPPMPGVHQQVMALPPPKSKSPALGYSQQRPPSRVTSAQPVADYGGFSPSIGGASHSRPGSRATQRQGSLASTSSHPSQSGASTSPSGVDPHYNGYGHSQPVHNSGQTSGAQPHASRTAQSGPPPKTSSLMYGHQQMASPSMLSQQSLDSPQIYHGQQEHAYTSYSHHPAESSQSRPQSRTSHAGSMASYGSQIAAPPPAQRGTSPIPPHSTSASLAKGQSTPSSAKESAQSGKQLGLADDDGMETLMDHFGKQSLHDNEGGASLTTAETSLSRAIRTPLPASEPDIEPRALSPQVVHGLDLSDDTSAGAKPYLSPQAASIPLVSVSLSSPDVDKKPVAWPTDDHDHASSNTHAPYFDRPIEGRDVEQDITRTQQEVKMEEEEEVDRKPDEAALAHSETWQRSHTERGPRGTSLDEAEETKPSTVDLQRAWSGDGTYGVSAAVQPPAQPEHSAFDTHHQQPYGGHDSPELTSNVAQNMQQVTPHRQHDSYDPYGAYNEQVDASHAYNVAPYGQETGHIAAAADQAYSYGENAYNQGPYGQASSSYQPYQPDLGTDYDSKAIADQANINRHRLQNRPAVPIASFGFNGKLVTFFPSSASPHAATYGMYEQPGGSVAPIKIQKLSELLPSESSGLDTFPGPLFMDTSATSASGKAKKKKELLVWLQACIEESQQERNYLGPGANENDRAKAEQKVLALQFLKVLLEHDGKLSGTPHIDQLVVHTLVPHMATAGHGTSTFAVAADLLKTGDSAPSLQQASARDLDTMQMHLLKGEKREAVTYALNNRLYTHALVIANGTDKGLFAEVVKDFLAFELSGSSAEGREPLKVAYSLLAGSGAACVGEFVSPKSPMPNGHGSHPTLSGQDNALYIPAGSRAPTPIGQSEYPCDVSPRTLSKWQETASMIVANRIPGDQQALTSLGDVLATNAWHKAAHICYLLSPSTSTIGGPSVPGVRWTLLGAPDPLQDPLAANDLEAIMLSEIVEFAFSLVTVTKGQEPYIGLPHLQAYRVLHARYLADTGHHSKAQKYCDAIGATLKLATKRSPFYHPTLLAQVKDLSDRLSMVSFQDKSGSWISRKVQRPTIDNVWSTLENRFAKFVTGDGEEDPAEEERKRKARDAAKGVAGPFAHYSSITPQGPEGLSRNGSYADLTMRATPPPQPTSVPNTVSNANTTKATHHRRSSSYAYGPYGADPYGSYVPQMPQTTEEPEQQGQGEYANQAISNEPQYGYVAPQNDSGWWSNSNGGQEQSSYSYGQAPTFSPVTEGFGSSDAQGLMSPMGFTQSPNMSGQNFQHQPSKLQQEVSAPGGVEDDDDDDLGLGNNSSKRRNEKANADVKTEDAATGTEKKTEAGKKEEAAKQTASASGSWLGRIFRREGSASPTTGPIRAKLGEETSFVYDPVEKRWVNKKTGSDTPPPAATPPPPRAQTASPAGYSHSTAATTKSGTPPPPAARSASATPMQAPAPPARSTPPPPAGGATSLPAAPPGPSSLSSRPPSRAASVPAGEMPPPPARKAGGGSGAAKKARSRYVDVFAQEQK